MAIRIQFRRDTAALWASNNPTLAEGELGLETDTKKQKMGDGVTAWNSLAYVIGLSDGVLYGAQSRPPNEQARARANIGLGNLAVAVAPSEIQGCELWLDANAIEDAQDGDSISSWVDSGPEGRDAGPALTPYGSTIYKKNILGGKPGVLFSNSALITPPFLDSTFDTDITVIVLSIFTGGTQGAQFGGVNSTGAMGTSPVASGLFFGGRGNKYGEFYIGAAGNASTPNAQQIGTPMCDVWRYDGATIQQRQNRQNALSVAATAAIGFNGGCLSVGSWGAFTGSARDHIGYIFEIAVFSRALDDDEVRAVEQYFREKYDILNRPRLVLMGDSIWFGNASGVTTTPPQLAMEALTTEYDYDIAVMAFPGHSLIAHGVLFAAAIDSDIVPGDDVTVISELGVNDFAGGQTASVVWALYKLFGLDRKAAGVTKFLIQTTTPTDEEVTIAGYDSERLSFNTTLRSDYADAGADGIVDMAANSDIGDQEDTYIEAVPPEDPHIHPSTNYYDGVHLNDAGNVIAAEVLRAAVFNLFSSRQQINYNLSVYGAGTAYSLTNTAAAINLGTTDPAIVLDKPGTYLIMGQVHLAYAGATVVAETATIKVRRTNNTAADLSAAPVLDLPVATTLTHSFGVFQIPPFIYTTINDDDALAIFANVSAALGAGNINAIDIGTSLIATRLYGLDS